MKLQAELGAMISEHTRSSDDANVRVEAVGLLHQRGTPDRLAEILSEYLNGPSYRYNVVVWIDRLLYAPATVSEYYREELQKRLNESR